MKLLKLIIPALAFCATGVAQTNTFPSSGDAGIGTTSPQGPLHILNNNNIQSILLESSSAGWGSGMIFKNTAGTGGKTYGIYSGAYGAFQIADNNVGVNRFLIDNAGNIGIGTNSPLYKLHLKYNSTFQIKSESEGWFSGILFQSSTTTKQLGLHYGSDGSSGLNTNCFRLGRYSNAEGWEANPVLFDLDAPHGSFCLNDAGNVGIGTTSPSEKLSVNGNILSKKVKVTQTGWADYVFQSSYKLRPLTEVEAYIKQHQHLPEIPSAAEVEKNGLDLGDNQAALLKKIEELTLYMIEMKRENEQMKKELQKQNRNIKALQKRK